MLFAKQTGKDLSCMWPPVIEYNMDYCQIFVSEYALVDLFSKWIWLPSSLCWWSGLPWTGVTQNLPMVPTAQDKQDLQDKQHPQDQELRDDAQGCGFL